MKIHFYFIYLFFFTINVILVLSLLQVEYLDILDTSVEEPTLTLFVSSQHPDFDVGFSQLFDGVWDAVLQFVLHSSRP